MKQNEYNSSQCSDDYKRYRRCEINPPWHDVIIFIWYIYIYIYFITVHAVIPKALVISDINIYKYAVNWKASMRSSAAKPSYQYIYYDSCALEWVWCVHLQKYVSIIINFSQLESN